MTMAATGQVFSIPFRHLWSTNFAGDLEAVETRPNGLARFVGDDKNQILRVLSDERCVDFFNQSNSHLWPLVLFGPSGTGKTSLALTIASDLADQANLSQTKTNSKHHGLNRNANNVVRDLGKPIVLTAVDFDRRFRAALAADSIPDFRRRLLRCPGLVIDDVHRIAEKPAAQHELLQLIDQMALRNRPLVLTIDRDPQQCDGLISQLISRFCGGLCLPVNEPGDEAREIIIRDLGQIHNLRLTENAVSLLVQKLNVTVPKIVNFFSQLKISLIADSKTDKRSPRVSRSTAADVRPAFNDTFDQVIDAALITRLFQRSAEDREQLAKIIIDVVATEFSLKPKDLRSTSRKQSIVLARNVAIYFNRKLLGTSFLKIGSLFGNRDHSTIVHAYRKIEARIFPATESDSDPTRKPVTDDNVNAEKVLMEQLEQRLTNQFASHLTFAP